MARLTGWRRIASAIWRPPQDPQIYGELELDATELLSFIDEMRAMGHHVTPTHLVGRALARALAEVPDLNVQIRGGRARPRGSIDIFFITAVHGGHDLSGVKVVDVADKSVATVAAELDGRSRALKRGDDAEFSRTKRLMDALPHPLLRLAIRTTALATQTLGLDLPALSLHAHPFGSAMVTSVGMLGLPHGFAPIAWMYDVPLLVLVGEIGPRPVVVDGRVVVRPVLPLTATIDHRYVDGSHISRAMAAFRRYLEQPRAFEAGLARSA
jgi:pyruvate dehydrogenase E2 component (dihydrolipoamide acetyltransferase)